LWFAKQLTIRRYDLGSTGDHIGYLKTQARPGPFSLTAAMDADDAIADFNVGDGGILSNHFSTKDGGVEPDGSDHIGSPDDVFESFDVHF